MSRDGALMQADVPPLAPGDDFQGYRVVAELARGGSARVYHVQNVFTRLNYALKLIAINRGDENLRRARDEFLILDQLQHPNVVRVFHAGVTSDERYVYILMELLEGYTLGEVLRRLGHLTVAEVLHVGIQVCDAAASAHRLKVVHRDFKPSNVFLCPGNHVKVLDFGIAKFLTAHRDTTGRLRWHGTPLYMAPEQLLGERATPRTDVYSIAVMLYELLLGEHYCFASGGRPTRNEIGHIQIHKAPTPLKKLIDGASVVATSDAIERAMAKDAAQRWSSASEFGEVLREAQRELQKDVARSGLAVNLRALVTEANHRGSGPWRPAHGGRARLKDATSWSQAGTLEGDVEAIFERTTMQDDPPAPDVWQMDSESGVVPAGASEAVVEQADHDTVSDAVDPAYLKREEDDLQVTVPGVPLAIRHLSAQPGDSPEGRSRRAAHTLRLGSVAPRVIYAPPHQPPTPPLGSPDRSERAEAALAASGRVPAHRQRSSSEFAPLQTPSPVSSSSRVRRPGRAPLSRWITVPTAIVVGLLLAVPLGLLTSRVLEWNRRAPSPSRSLEVGKRERQPAALPPPPTPSVAAPEPAHAPPTLPVPQGSPLPSVPPEPAPASPLPPTASVAPPVAEAPRRAPARELAPRPQPSAPSSAPRAAARTRTKTKPPASDREHELIFRF